MCSAAPGEGGADGAQAPPKKPKGPRPERKKHLWRRSAKIGVSFHTGTGKWVVSIRHMGKNHHCGTFAADAEEEAAKAFDAAARR